MMVFLDNVSQEASAAKAALGDTSHQQQKDFGIPCPWQNVQNFQVLN